MSDYKATNTDTLIGDKKIDDSQPPNEIPSNEIPSNINMEKCQKLQFSYVSKDDNFTLTYYVPFLSPDKLNKVINKAIKQTELTAEDKEITITVNNAECDLTDFVCISKASQIDDVATYISTFDFNCSSCIEFNRSWACCGQFAPFMYIYSFFLFEEGNYDRYKDKFGHTDKIETNIQVDNIAKVFYKIFSGYATGNPKYIEHRQNVGDLYGVDIPDVNENLDFWLDIDKNIFRIHTNPSFLSFENNKSYLILLNNNHEGIKHFCFIYRCNNYIIICDSWTDYHSRMRITRIMEYDEFINCIVKINNLYKSHEEGSGNISDELLLYNFIIDSLFLVPYSEGHISIGQQSFSEINLSYIAVIDSNKIVEVLDTLVEKSKPFNMYLDLGGSKKRRKKTIKNKRKQNKKGKSRKNKNKNKNKNIR
jgi:hypothetical protein